MQSQSISAPAELRFRWLDGIDAKRAERLARLLNRVLELDDTVGFPGPIPHEQALEVVAELDAAVRGGRSHVLVVENDERVFAQCVLVPNRSPNNRHVAWIVRAMIDPALRRRGLVRVGISSLAEKCESLGVEVLCIDVRAGTPAEMIWRHLGFQAIGTHPDYARIRGQTFEGVYMTQRVADLKKRCAVLGGRGG